MAMTMPQLQQSFRGFEHYANKAPNADADNSNSPLDVRIRNNIQKISNNDSVLKSLAEKVGTQLDSRELRDKLKTKQSDTNTLSKETADLLKEFSKACPSDSKLQKGWKVQQSRYNDMFRDVLKDYQETQKTLRTKERATLRESLTQSGLYKAHLDESGSIVKEDGGQIQMDSIKEEEDFELIKQREEDLKLLENDIVGLNSIFKDLAGMVQEQGEEIDRIEEVVEVAVKDVEEGVKELEVAVEHTTAARKKTLLLVVIVVVVIAIIITIILVTTLK